MKYKSLRFFIQINSLLGYVVIYGGILFSLIGAILAGISVGGAAGFFLFIIILTAGGVASVINGLLIWALGDLFQCFIDIEENTGRAVNALRDFGQSRPDGDRPSASSAEQTPSTYMCSDCSSFQRSDVISCTKCGADNPHHPSNKEKTATSKANVASETAALATQCPRCGSGMNQMDKFCSSCGYARTRV